MNVGGLVVTRERGYGKDVLGLDRYVLKLGWDNTVKGSNDAPFRYAWCVRGDKGVVAWQAGPMTVKSSAITKLLDSSSGDYFAERAVDGMPWIAWDLGYHLYEHPEVDYKVNKQEGCPVLDWEPCYTDGTALGADELLQVYVKEPLDERVFPVLGAYYTGWTTP